MTHPPERLPTPQEHLLIPQEHLMLPRGFQCAGLAAGIKKSGATDLGLVYAPEGAAAAAIFTRNLAAAAPIQVSRAHLKANRGNAMALLVNSGCANAATGEEGAANCERTVRALAYLLECAPESVLVNSTGVIGVQLPTEKILDALPRLQGALQGESVEPFAQAIMTTDTRMKVAMRRVKCREQTSGGAAAHTRCAAAHNGGAAAHNGGGSPIYATVVGVAKGAGMIHPDMATMICAVLTDASITPAELSGMLRRAADHSFHRISVDGDTSTNDSVFALASGKAGECDPEEIERAIHEVARDLAMMVVRDGEGFERGIAVRVTRARTQNDALQVARTVAMSLLVRTAVTGGDPNWGRILAAVGRAGVPIEMESVRITAGGVPLFAGGSPSQSSPEDRRQAFTADVVEIGIDLASGEASDHFYSCGLTKRYVEINAEYTT